MNCAIFFRSFYRLIVRMHPCAFRERFGDEMLWIFEEELRRDAGGRALFDGVLSLLRQRSNIERDREPVVAGFVLIDTGLRIAPRRFVEAGITASLFLAGFLVLLGKTGNLSLVPACLPGAPRATPRLLEAPSRIQALPTASPNLHGRLDARRIDNAAASAVQVIHAAQLSNSAATGYCPVN